MRSMAKPRPASGALGGETKPLNAAPTPNATAVWAGMQSMRWFRAMDEGNTISPLTIFGYGNMI